MGILKNSNLVVNICRLFYARVDQASFVPGTDRFHKTVTFPSGKYWNEIYFTPASADFTENDKPGDPGQLREQVLKFIFPGEDTSNVSSLEDLLPPLMILMQETSGNYRLFGCPDNPVKMTGNRSTGSKTRSELTFSCLAQEPAWWHDLPITTLPS